MSKVHRHLLLHAALAVACVAFGLSGCERAHKPNVVLLVLDTLRGDRLSCAGYGRETTPRIDALAARGAMYSRAFSTCFWTLPAHASLFTGLHPVQAGATSETLHLPDQNLTVAEALSDAGYRTAGFVCNSWVSKERGFGQGFQEFLEMWRAENRAGADTTRGSMETFTVDRMVAWITSAANDDKPFFLFANLNGVHLPYTPAEPYASRFLAGKGYNLARVRQLAGIQSGWGHLVGEMPLDQTDYRILNDLYDAEVAWADALVGEVVDALERSGVLDDTIVIVTSDHGEHLGEKGKIDHMSTMYDAGLHIPLVICYPRGFPAGTRVDGLVSIVDLAPTVLDLCGAADRAPLLRPETTSLARKGRAAEDFILAGNERPVVGIKLLQGRYPGYDWKTIDYRMRCVRAPDEKLIWNENRGTELYNLARDPAEETNLAEQQPDVQRDLMAVLGKSFAKMQTSKEYFMFESTDREALEKLRSLGYIN